MIICNIIICVYGRIFYFVNEFYIDKRAGKIKQIWWSNVETAKYLHIWPPNSLDFACTFVNIEFDDKRAGKIKQFGGKMWI